MKTNFCGFALWALAAGTCLSLVVCWVQHARLVRMEQSVRMAGEMPYAVESKSCSPQAESNKALDGDIEIVRRLLHAAYKVEQDDFYASHRNMGGGNYSYAMLHHAEKDFADGWRNVATNWFYSTARNDFERRRMEEYDVGADDFKYTRDELRQVMVAWKMASSGKGSFEGQNVCFTNGVAMFMNKEYGCKMELRLRKEQIWVYEGSVYIFASSDVAGNDGYGASDALCENWFLRFDRGKIADCCHFRHGAGAFLNLRCHFQASNDMIVITSVESGDIVGVLYLGLIERTDSKGVKSRTFKYDGR